METLAYIITIPSLILLIISVWSCFYYLHFKKGNIKKYLLLLLVSLILTAGGIGLGIFSEINKAPYAYQISGETKIVLDTKSYEDSTDTERQTILNLGFLPLSKDDREKYNDKIKEFYVKYYSKLRNLDEKTISSEYDKILKSKQENKY